MLDIKLQSTKIGDTVKKYKINYIVNNDTKENKNFKMMTFIKNIIKTNMINSFI